MNEDEKHRFWREVDEAAHELSARHCRNDYLHARLLQKEANAAGNMDDAEFWARVASALEPRSRISS